MTGDSCRRQTYRALYNIADGECDAIGIGNEGDVGKIFRPVRLFRRFKRIAFSLLRKLVVSAVFDSWLTASATSDSVNP